MLFVYILATMLLLAWIIFPVLHKSPISTGDPLTKERIESAEAALKNLYGKGRHKIREEDFPNIESRLMLLLAKLCHSAGISPDQYLAKAERAPATRVAADNVSFCSQCGHGVTVDFSFCPQCGQQVKAA